MSIKNNFSSTKPSLLLDFANSKSLDPRLNFFRASSATYTGPDGLVKIAGIGEPRFTHNAITRESLGILIEEPRTNLKTYSEDATYWGSGGDRVTISTNTAYAPDGNLTADSFVEQATNKSWRWVEWGQSYTSGNSYTVSCFVKAGTGPFGTIYFFTDNSVFPGGSAVFDLSGNGSVVSLPANTTGSITAYPNGWYRISATQTAGASSTGYVAIGFVYSSNFSVAITGSTSNTMGYVWGIQLEAGEYPTSYIPTTTSTATRSTDYLSVTAPITRQGGWLSNLSGTVIYEGISSPYNNTNSWYWVLGTGSSNRYGMFHNAYSTTLYSAYTIRAGSATFTPAMNLNYSTKFKSGFAYQRSGASNQVSYINGTLVSESNSAQGPNFEGTTPVLHLGRFLDDGNSLYPIDTTISKFAYYPQRLTNSQIQALTL
jgi:hypothetical protein